jgi:hypothetical protein
MASVAGARCHFCGRIQLKIRSAGWLIAEKQSSRRRTDAGHAGTPDEVGTVGALLMGSDGAFITGSDFLMDGGVTAAYWFGELAPK